ncbi:MAG: PAC2 family protein [Streptosporangiales bacterium]|nr:PAC2 family protein [Streptosporangiales bacterium]
MRREVESVLDPGGLYELGSEPPELRKPVLLCGMDGFVDAGAVGALARDKVLSGRDGKVVATFDVDRLIDYRARRPVMTYVEDHWEGYEAPQLVVRATHDDAGVPFLLLAGPEPDHEWEGFTAAVGELIERLDVRLTVGFHGIPMAVPHTRPIGLTAHATRPELVADYTRRLGTVQVPGSAAALLELRLGQAGRDALGFAVHVPHYLTQVAYPAAALTALDAVTAATGLTFGTEELRSAAERTDSEIARQVEGSEELASIVHALERQYDEYVAARDRDDLSESDLANLPTAEELGTQFERFLAEQERGRDTPDR